MIDVIASHAAVRTILTAPLAERPALLRTMLEPVAGMYRYFPARSTSSRCTTWAAASASMWTTTGRSPRSTPSVTLTWGRVTKALQAAPAHQLAATPGIRVPDVQVLVVSGDRPTRTSWTSTSA